MIINNIGLKIIGSKNFTGVLAINIINSLKTINAIPINFNIVPYPKLSI